MTGRTRLGMPDQLSFRKPSAPSPRQRCAAALVRGPARARRRRTHIDTRLAQEPLEPPQAREHPLAATGRLEWMMPRRGGLRARRLRCAGRAVWCGALRLRRWRRLVHPLHRIALAPRPWLHRRHVAGRGSCCRRRARYLCICASVSRAR